LSRSKTPCSPARDATWGASPLLLLDGGCQVHPRGAPLHPESLPASRSRTAIPRPSCCLFFLKNDEGEPFSHSLLARAPRGLASTTGILRRPHRGFFSEKRHRERLAPGSHAGEAQAHRETSREGLGQLPRLGCGPPWIIGLCRPGHGDLDVAPL